VKEKLLGERRKTAVVLDLDNLSAIAPVVVASLPPAGTRGRRDGEDLLPQVEKDLVIFRVTRTNDTDCLTINLFTIIYTHT
jgi:hypothetical protein